MLLLSATTAAIAAVAAPCPPVADAVEGGGTLLFVAILVADFAPFVGPNWSFTTLLLDASSALGFGCTAVRLLIVARFGGTAFLCAPASCLPYCPAMNRQTALSPALPLIWNPKPSLADFAAAAAIASRPSS